MRVSGKGTVAICASPRGVKLLRDVQYVPNLARNLPSVGQLLASGYVIIFHGDECIISNKATGSILARVRMTKWRMFPLDVARTGSANLVIGGLKDSMLWHLRYGHLPQKGSSMHQTT